MPDERPDSEKIAQNLVDLLSDNDYTVSHADADTIEAEDEDGTSFTIHIETEDDEETE